MSVLLPLFKAYENILYKQLNPFFETKLLLIYVDFVRVVVHNMLYLTFHLIGKTA